MGISLSVFTQLFSKVAQSDARQTGAKTKFNVKIALQGHAFWDRRKANGGLRIAIYNNAGLISEVSEEIASENAENYHCRQTHSRLMPPPQGTPANICINLILPESRVTGLHVCW